LKEFTEMKKGPGRYSLRNGLVKGIGFQKRKEKRRLSKFSRMSLKNERKILEESVKIGAF